MFKVFGKIEKDDNTLLGLENFSFARSTLSLHCYLLPNLFCEISPITFYLCLRVCLINFMRLMYLPHNEYSVV